MSGVPVITCDGPSGSGKGTISRALAIRLGWHLLDSGALYRLVALISGQLKLNPDDSTQFDELCRQAEHMDVRFEVVDHGEGERVWLGEQDVTDAIRTEAVGNRASGLATRPRIRQALLAAQQHFRKPPGLVADGRDMGTVVFPEAELKLFLTASAGERARRRHAQLSASGADANIDRIYREISERDERDRNRQHSPLLPANDAVEVDTTAETVEQSLNRIERMVRDRGLA